MKWTPKNNQTAKEPDDSLGTTTFSSAHRRARRPGCVQGPKGLRARGAGARRGGGGRLAGQPQRVARPRRRLGTSEPSPGQATMGTMGTMGTMDGFCRNTRFNPGLWNVAIWKLIPLLSELLSFRELKVSKVCQRKVEHQCVGACNKHQID